MACFETLAVRVLNARVAGMKLLNCGGRSDGGVDFSGSWLLPGRESVSVQGQCKDHARKVGPSVVREMRSLVDGLGVLVASQHGFSREAMSAADAQNHTQALMLIRISVETEQIEQIFLNRSAKSIVSLGSLLGTTGRTPVLMSLDGLHTLYQ